MTRSKVSRRNFLTIGGAAAAASLTRLPQAEAEQDPPQQISRVVLVRRQDVLDDDNRAVPTILHAMLNQAVAAVMGAPTEEAWRRLISPDDVVGIKSNEWGKLPTPPALEDAIRTEVLRVGVSEDDVAVDDRGVRRNPVFQRATALINTRPMRTHHWSGLGTCLKNLIMFVPRPQEYHGDACAPLGAVWRLPELDGKVRLNVLVMLTPQFHGVGPHSFSSEFVWPYGGLIVGTDPVAVDATGARIIEAKRRLHFGAERPIAPPPHHIQVAGERYGLGVSDPEHIDLVRLGWMEDALI
jgi:hypothetical protein